MDAANTYIKGIHMGEKATQEEHIMLKLMEKLCMDGKIQRSTFASILHDYRNKIDLSEFSCYDSEARR